MSNDLVADNTGLVHFKNVYTGSCVIFPWANDLFMITAGHVIYGKKFDATVDCKDWTVLDSKGKSHPVKEVVCDKKFAKKHDIILVKLLCSSRLKDFNKIRFCTVPRNPSHTFLFRGKYEFAREAVTHTHITYNSKHRKQVWFNCNIDRSKLTNSDFKSGSDWLGGWSGSGLFMANHKELICSGVMVEIPESGNNSQLVFSSIEVLKDVGFGPTIEDSQIFDLDKVFNAKSLMAILDDVDERSIREWELNTENNEPLTLINRKLERLYPEETFNRHKTQVIRNLMTGKTYIDTELTKQEEIHKIYDQARKVYELKDKIFYVNTRAEARSELNKLQAEYQGMMDEQLKDKLAPAEIKILGFYDVYDWISKCSLDFLKDE